MDKLSLARKYCCYFKNPSPSRMLNNNIDPARINKRLFSPGPLEVRSGWAKQISRSCRQEKFFPKTTENAKIAFRIAEIIIILHIKRSTERVSREWMVFLVYLKRSISRKVNMTYLPTWLHFVLVHVKRVTS